jgi:hypothetical protein
MIIFYLNKNRSYQIMSLESSWIRILKKIPRASVRIVRLLIPNIIVIIAKLFFVKIVIFLSIPP